MALNWHKNHARNFTKVLKNTNQTRNPNTYFYQSKNVKYTIKQSKIYHESYRKNSRKLEENYNKPGVQIARKGVYKAGNLKKLKRNQKRSGYWSNPHAGGSGSPERHRGVGLIRIH